MKVRHAVRKLMKLRVFFLSGSKTAYLSTDGGWQLGFMQRGHFFAVPCANAECQTASRLF